MEPIETEEDLQRYIGQSESIRLEFKASALLSQPPDRMVKQLTEEVSAFANTEGGMMIIGIKERDSGQKSFGVEIDEGTDPTTMQPERLEQLIASNMSPPVPGLVVRPIPLSGPKKGRVAYVVIVPKGSTAYQATKTYCYYGRTEFAATRLYDNVIRLLMTRGRVAHAVIEPMGISKVSADEEYERRQASLRDLESRGGRIRGVQAKMFQEEQRKKVEAPPRTFDEYSFSLAIRNDGGVTIRDCLLAVSGTTPFEVTVGDTRLGSRPHYFDFTAGNAVRRYESSSFGVSEEEVRSEARLYPEHTMTFPGTSFVARPPAGSSNLDCTLEWRLYLDNAPMCSGTLRIDLTEVLHQAE